jgi:tetratricopeptide (TPR) repeat protein
MSRLQDLEAMLDANPDDPFLIYALAREYELGKATMQALLMYEHLVTDHPDYIATYYHYSKLLYSAGNRNEAIRLLQKGIEKGIPLGDHHAVSEMKSLLALWLNENDDD